MLVPEDVQHKPHPIAAGPPLFVCIRKLTSSYTAVQACAVYAARWLIIFAAVEVFLDVRTDHQSNQSFD